MTDTLLFVGLGNPGKEYQKTRHNVGFMAIDKIINCHNFSNSKIKFNSEISEGKIAGRKIITAKPQNYMNRSGFAVLDIIQFYKIPLSNVYVFYDDIDLPIASVRFKNGGGAGGHNGIKSVDQMAGINYFRVRIGVDRPINGQKIENYVLENFTNQEREYIEDCLNKISNNLEMMIDNKIDQFLNSLNNYQRS